VKVGDLVSYQGYLGVVVSLKKLRQWGDATIAWLDGSQSYCEAAMLEVINESR
jgi:hypothetical protein